MAKKARNPLKRCLEKQSNMVKYCLKRRKAIEKPKSPDPSNFFFFFHCLQGCKEQYFFRNTSFPKENWNNLLYSTQEIRVCVGLFSIRRQLQRWNNMIPRKRRAASLISKPQTKNQNKENCPEMNSVSFLWSYSVAKFKISKGQEAKNEGVWPHSLKSGSNLGQNVNLISPNFTR